MQSAETIWIWSNKFIQIMETLTTLSVMSYKQYSSDCWYIFIMQCGLCDNAL